MEFRLKLHFGVQLDKLAADSVGLTRFKRTPQVKEEPKFFFSNRDLWMVIDRIGLPIGARAYAVASQDCPLAAQIIKNDS